MTDAFTTGDSPSQQAQLAAMAGVQQDLLKKLGPGHSFQDYLNAINKIDFPTEVAKKLGQPPPKPPPQFGPLSAGALGQIGNIEQNKMNQSQTRSPLPIYSTAQQTPSPYQQPTNQNQVSGYSTLPSYGRNPFYQQAKAGGFNYY